VILALITEKLNLRTFILPDTSTYRVWVRCTSCTPLLSPDVEYITVFAIVNFSFTATYVLY